MEGYKFLYVFNKRRMPNYCCKDFSYMALVKLEIPDDAIVVYPIDSRKFEKEQYIAKLHEKSILDTTPIPLSIKCRCSKAKIVEVIDYYLINDITVLFNHNNIIKYLLYKLANVKANPEDLIFCSTYAYDFLYKFNEYVKPDKINLNTSIECSNGIHFCKDIQDLMNYINECTNIQITDTYLDYNEIIKKGEEEL